MKSPIFLLGVLLPIVLLAADLPAVHSRSLGIEGIWNAKDPRDGSCLRLQVTKVARSGDRVYAITGSDRLAADWCPGGARMQGIGVLEPEGLLITSAVYWCNPTGPDPRYFRSDALRYDPESDTISSAAGASYHRQVLLRR
jgi:hypothetical protein